MDSESKETPKENLWEIKKAMLSWMPQFQKEWSSIKLIQTDIQEKKTTNENTDCSSDQSEDRTSYL